jgi:hypothetical protein
MDILSTLKSEYSRTFILILIPGLLAITPIADLFYHLYFLGERELYTYLAIMIFLAAVMAGFVIQDLGARLEMKLDQLYCTMNRKGRKHCNFWIGDVVVGLSDFITIKNNDSYRSMYNEFTSQFNLYLFNLRHENHIITHYYRSMLVRLKFEVHLIVAIIMMWLGLVTKYPNV